MMEYKGASFDEMDVDAILARKPQVVLVDELAHTNVEGSKHKKRYEDVMMLVDAKIDVLSTMNVQHIESLMPMVRNITGVQVRETVPDWVMQGVTEIVLTDLTPEALQTRMRRGDIYPLDRAERALGHFFRPGNLLALRELALQQVTRAVDRSLESYLEKEEAGKRLEFTSASRLASVPVPAAQYLIARAARMAQRIDAEFFVIYVDTGVDDNPEDQRSLRQNIQFAQNLGRTRLLRPRERRSPKKSLRSFAKSTSRRLCLDVPHKRAGGGTFIFLPSTGFFGTHLRWMSTSSLRK